MKEIIKTIKEKKELSYLDDAYVRKIVTKYFVEHKKILNVLKEKDWNPKSKEFKQAVKEVRALLREVYGVFQKTSGEQRKNLLDAYNGAQGRGEKMAALDALLASHQSTAERREHFKEVYHELFLRTGKAESVMDLGCGFNPMSYSWLGCKPKYYASDISSQDLDLVREFFEEEGIEGEVAACDLVDKKERKKYFASVGYVEQVWLLKLVDTLESQQRNVSKTIIEELRSVVKPKWIVASFPLISIGGKKMREGGKENWFSRFLDGKGLTYELFTVGGEEFWVIKTSKS